MNFMKNLKAPRNWLLFATILMAVSLISLGSTLFIDKASAPASAAVENVPQADGGTVFLPSVLLASPWSNPFGTETIEDFIKGRDIYTKTMAIHTGWLRMGTQISWKNLQPDEGGPIQWDQLAKFEEELRTIRQAGIQPMVIVKDHPYWAVIEDARSDGQLTSCAPIKPEKLEAFADFFVQLVNRYKISEFNVHNWEIGNEPDVDPDLVPVDSGLGCWGDASDTQYYGGQLYGEMLNYVAPRIRQADPRARIIVGGLLISSPNTTDINLGRQEYFLKGVLEAGAGDSFDVVGVHWHPSYWDEYADYDAKYNAWENLGGATFGKAEFLRDTLAAYGYDKPLTLNEMGFGCPVERDGVTWCEPPDFPDEVFYQNQADMVARMYVRGMAAGYESILWYSLDEAGWRNTGLLYEDDSAKPAYDAYMALSGHIFGAAYNGEVDYGPGIEAYEFVFNNKRVHVLWAIDPGGNFQVDIPSSQFQAASGFDGTPLSPSLSGNNYVIDVGFSAVYIQLAP